MLCCGLNENSLRAGIGYIIAGILIRLWSNGYAIKNDKLTTSGPYAFVRNPLYLGTFLIAIGFVIVLKSDYPQLEWAAGSLFILALAFMYYRTIKAEQGMLLARFGDAYRDYCHKVPAMIPCLIPYSKGEKWPFNLQRLMNSKEHKPVFWIFILLVAFHIKTRVLLEHKPLTHKSLGLVVLALILIVLDFIYEINKKRFQIKK
ncbi:MAG: isoprenylcysteine carboxylmethyltransferase family protein [Candidatus Omnitrophica bacterium]|nr:isoprenylcysteine carboxylmethyltransferase family protein [Candidatus Omnitrophota bacterium]